MAAYGGGLRVGEVVRLKLTDIQSERRMMRIEQGKNRKDRYTVLSERLLEELRIYWKEKRPNFWLFPGWHGPLTTRSAQRIYRDALVHAGIDRGHGFHTLRHCFGTHLFEAGVDLRTIQALMGHASVITTTRYVQVSRTILEGTRSPMDLLAVAEANTIV